MASDPRFVVKLLKIYASNADAANFHALLDASAELDAIPAGAPTYVTRTARERLRGTAIAARVMPEVRAFSTESARQILTFVVRANMAALEGGGEDDR